MTEEIYEPESTTYRPQLKTVEQWVNHLKELGLRVYGSNMNIKTGQEFCSCMDYNAEEIVARRKHMHDGTLWRDTEVY